MSGRRIDDHSFWAGKGGKGMVLPDGGGKMKQEHSAEGSGHVGMDYPDTTEKIHKNQMKGDSQAKAHPMKPGYRY
jgi:hypothetical protein